MCPSLLSLLFRLWVVSIGVLMEESFVGVFCLLVFLVCVVSLGAGHASSSGLLGFLGVGALDTPSGFLGVSPFLFFQMTCIHPFSELRGSSGFRAGLDTSITVSFSGFSFVVSVVWIFFWGRLL